MYGYSKKVNLSLEEADKKVREELQKEGFGVLTEIDVKETLKKKLNVDFKKYRILGACNPQMAFKALQSEKELGLMMPCNVIVYDDNGKTTVACILPSVQMKKIGNQELGPIADEVEAKLKKVIDNVK